MDNLTFQTEVLQRLAVLETLIKEQDYKGVSDLSNKAYNMALKNEEELKEIKDKNKWYFRTIIGCILTVLINLLITFIKSN